MTARRALVATVALAAAAHAASFLGSGPVDDDFIAYRYAENLVLGQGLVFNVGERVEGYSAPLWVIVLAGARALGLDLVRTSQALSIAAAGAAAFAVGLAWLRRYPRERWPLPALVVAATPAVAWHGVAGLGTTLLAALLALFASALDEAVRRGRPPWGAAAWLSLACLLRQECALFALPFAAAELRRTRHAACLLPLAALAGWTLFRLGYYGRWMPVTWSVKKLPLAVDLAYGARYLGRATLETGFGLWLLLAPFAARAPRASPPAPRVSPDATRVLLAGLLLHAAYVVYVGGDFMRFARFLVPTLPIAAFLGLVGARTVFDAQPRAGRVALFVLLLVSLQWTQLERPQLFGEHRFFERRWARLGSHLGRVMAPDTRVALSPIGAFGWTSKLPIVDVLGLTHEESLDEAPELEIGMKGHHRFDAEYVLDRRPHLVILGNGVRQPDGGLVVNPWEATLYRHPRFRSDYERWLVPIPGDAPLDLWKLHGAPPPPGAEKP